MPQEPGLRGQASVNTGDWVENCTAFVEYEVGNFELLRYFDLVSCPETADEQHREHELFSAAAIPPSLVARHAAEWESEHAVRH